MSTRGAVGIGTPKKFLSVYNHFDSYPTGLGKEVWGHLQGKDLSEFAKELLSYGDWREYLNEGVCEYCGKKAGQPCNISGVLGTGTPFQNLSYHNEQGMRAFYQGLPAWRDREDDIEDMIARENQLLANVKATGFIDPLAVYHSHVSKKESQMTQNNVNPVYIEWAYVIDPERGVFHVLESAGESDKLKMVVLGSFLLNDTEPDWSRLEWMSREAADRDTKAYLLRARTQPVNTQ